MFSQGTSHCYLNIATREPTINFLKGVSDYILVDHFPRRLCPGEGDGGGIRGHTAEGGRGGGYRGKMQQYYSYIDTGFQNWNSGLCDRHDVYQ